MTENYTRTQAESRLAEEPTHDLRVVLPCSQTISHFNKPCPKMSQAHGSPVHQALSHTCNQQVHFVSDNHSVPTHTQHSTVQYDTRPSSTLPFKPIAAPNVASQSRSSEKARSDALSHNFYSLNPDATAWEPGDKKASIQVNATSTNFYTCL